MHILFADVVSPEEHATKQVGALLADPQPRRWWDVLIEQLINSAIVGGIAGLTATDLGVAWKAFALTMFFELRKYRKL